MRMSERRLRRIVREIISENYGLSNELGNSKVQDKIEYYEKNRHLWDNHGHRYQFHDMMAGGSGGVIEYAEDDITPIKTVRDGYPGWEDDEFKEVVDELGS